MKPSTRSSPRPSARILNAFYGKVYSQVSTESSLSYYFSGQAGHRKMQLAAVRRSKSLAQLKPGRLVQPKIRKAFPDTAFWVADVRTAGNGQATVKFDYPDAITSWRATTRGVTQDTKVGSAVENTIVRKNIMVRLVVPRFFRRGDEITLSTIVQNYLPTDKTAQVSMQFEGLQVLDGAQQNINVPTRGLVKVDYRVKVLDVDSAKVLGKALTDVESDAMELTLPVVPFGVKLAMSKSGSIAGAGTSDTSQPVTFPTTAEPGTRKLTISVMPSIAGSVFAALDYLTSYPYGCTEQTMSSFLPDVLVADALKKLGVKSNIDPATLEQAGAGRTRPPLQLSARRRRMGLVADRRQPSLHDRVRARRIEPGQGRGLRREAGCDRQGPRVAAARSSTSRRRFAPICAPTWRMRWCSAAATATLRSSIRCGRSARRSRLTAKRCSASRCLRSTTAARKI